MPHRPTTDSARRSQPATLAKLVYIDPKARFLTRLQDTFETARDQFDDAVLGIPEWREAADALDRAYHAWAGRAPQSTVETLCTEAQRRVEMAVQMSMVSGYYDGRLDRAIN